MTDAIRELFELLTKKEKSGSDYTGTVTRVDGKTAYVQFDGSDITDTPVALSIGAKAGDSVRVRVADGRAWLVGNDDAPPNDSSEVGYELALTNALIRRLTTEQINGENGWINLLLGTFNYGNKLIWNGRELTLNGKVVTTAGTIGGWTISGDQICKAIITGGYEYRAILNAPANISANTVAFAIAVRTNNGSGSTGQWTYPFTVTYGGSLTATKGALGGWTIGPDSLYSGSTSGTNAQITLKSGDSGYIRVQNDTAGMTELNNAGFLHQTSSGQINIAGGALTIADRAHHYPSYMLSISSRSMSYTETTGGGLKFFIDGTRGAITAAGAITAGSSIKCERETSSSVASADVIAKSTRTGCQVGLSVNNNGQAGIWSNGYWNGSGFVSGGSWLLSRETDGRTKIASYSGTYSYPIVTYSTVVGNRVGGFICNSATQLSIYGDWKATDGTAKYMYVSVSSSDPRLKENIAQTQMVALDLIDKIQLHEFDWKTDAKHWDVGFIAPELLDIDPNLVIVPENEDEGYYGVDDFYLTGIQTKAIQELHAEVKSLKAEIAELKEIIAVLMEGKK